MKAFDVQKSLNEFRLTKSSTETLREKRKRINEYRQKAKSNAEKINQNEPPIKASKSSKKIKFSDKVIIKKLKTTVTDKVLGHETKTTVKNEFTIYQGKINNKIKQNEPFKASEGLTEVTIHEYSTPNTDEVTIPQETIEKLKKKKPPRVLIDTHILKERRQKFKELVNTSGKDTSEYKNNLKKLRKTNFHKQKITKDTKITKKIVGKMVSEISMHFAKTARFKFPYKLRKKQKKLFKDVLKQVTRNLAEEIATASKNDSSVTPTKKNGLYHLVHNFERNIQVLAMLDKIDNGGDKAKKKNGKGEEGFKLRELWDKDKTSENTFGEHFSHVKSELLEGRKSKTTVSTAVQLALDLAEKRRQARIEGRKELNKPS